MLLESQYHGRRNDETKECETQEQQRDEHREAVHPGQRHAEQQQREKREDRSRGHHHAGEAELPAERGGELRSADEAKRIDRKAKSVLRRRHAVIADIDERRTGEKREETRHAKSADEGKAEKTRVHQ